MEGSLAKIGATMVTYPMIVVKSRLQVWVQEGMGVEGQG
jgi:hypothetical protein